VDALGHELIDNAPHDVAWVCSHDAHHVLSPRAVSACS
jgi:hypothetical protein